MKTRNTILLALLGLVLLFGVNYMLFTGMLQGLPPAVEEALESDSSIQVSSSFTILTMEPTSAAHVGLVMYGEGRQDVRMYAPIARLLAKDGVKVVVMERRLQMNQTYEQQFERIDAVIQDDPNLMWYIGGHTSGARIPVEYAIINEDKFEGIVLWAARLIGDSEVSDISDISLPVLYIYGTLDDANVTLLESNLPFLPEQTELVSIVGANRADFSYWGPMAADVGSSIPIPEIQKLASEATVDFLLP